jgi:hypothetical protein
MTKDEIVAVVKKLGTAQELQEKRLKAEKKEKTLILASFLAAGATFVLLPFALTPWGWHLPFSFIYYSLFLVSICVMGVGAVLSAGTSDWKDFALLTETKRSREALELVEKSSHARLVRDAVLWEGRRLVGYDLLQMRRLHAEELAVKAGDVREVEEDELDARLHVLTPECTS